MFFIFHLYEKAAGPSSILTYLFSYFLFLFCDGVMNDPS